MLGARLAGFVPEDYGLVRDAINRGKPLGSYDDPIASIGRWPVS